MSRSNTMVTVSLFFMGVSASGKGAKFAKTEPVHRQPVDWVNLPMSKITFDASTPKTVVDVELPEWLATSEGLI